MNDKYASLAKALLGEETQRLCRKVQPDWSIIPLNVEDSSQREQSTSKGGQSKSATLSAAIEVIDLLSRACNAEVETVRRKRQVMDRASLAIREILNDGLVGVEGTAIGSLTAPQQ